MVLELAMWLPVLFLLIAGMTAWLLGEQPSTAGPAPAVAHSNSAKK